MKEVVQVLLDKKMILKKLNPVNLSLLSTRKKIKIFTGVDQNSNYISIFSVAKKSRFLQKDVQDFEELFLKLLYLQGHNFKKKILILNAPLCSKAKVLLKEYRWRLVDVTD